MDNLEGCFPKNISTIKYNLNKSIYTNLRKHINVAKILLLLNGKSSVTKLLFAENTQQTIIHGVYVL